MIGELSILLLLLDCKYCCKSYEVKLTRSGGGVAYANVDPRPYLGIRTRRWHPRHCSPRPGEGPPRELPQSRDYGAPYCPLRDRQPTALGGGYFRLPQKRTRHLTCAGNAQPDDDRCCTLNIKGVPPNRKMP